MVVCSVVRLQVICCPSNEEEKVLNLARGSKSTNLEALSFGTVVYDKRVKIPGSTCQSMGFT